MNTLSRLQETAFRCRPGCAACCIALSISSPLPGMPGGKPAGARCPHLNGDNCCRLFGLPERPTVCSSLQPSMEMCGADAAEALAYLAWLEDETRPDGTGRVPGVPDCEGK
jgi:Fe-S-cluster containining protein